MEIGSLNRECAYRLELLNGYLKTKPTQVSFSPPFLKSFLFLGKFLCSSSFVFQVPSQQIQGQFQEECLKICSESSNGLRELALAIRKMVPPLTAKAHIEKAKVAAENLKSHLEEWRFEELNTAMEIVGAASLASVLVDSICCVEKVVDSVQKLASAAGFKAVEVQSSVAPEQQNDLQDQGSSLQPCHGTVLLAHHVITVDEGTPC